jgi:hypothetical protein
VVFVRGERKQGLKKSSNQSVRIKRCRDRFECTMSQIRGKNSNQHGRTFVQGTSTEHVYLRVSVMRRKSRWVELERIAGVYCSRSYEETGENLETCQQENVNCAHAQYETF